MTKIRTCQYLGSDKNLHMTKSVMCQKVSCDKNLHVDIFEYMKKLICATLRSIALSSTCVVAMRDDWSAPERCGVRQNLCLQNARGALRDDVPICRYADEYRRDVAHRDTIMISIIVYKSLQIVTLFLFTFKYAYYKISL